jgi:hypothetical protein
MTMMIFTKTSVDLQIRKSSCTDSLRSDRPKCDTGMGLGLGRAGTYETFRTHVHSRGRGVSCLGEVPMRKKGRKVGMAPGSYYRKYDSYPL